MTLNGPFVDVRLRPGEEPTPKRLAEVLEAVQSNFDNLFNRFPIQTNELAGKLAQTVLPSRMLYGRVNTTEAGFEGVGFTVERTEKGTVKLTFSNSFKAVPAVVPAAELFTLKANPTSISKTSAIVGLNAGGVATDGIFDFIAIGLR